MVALHDPNWKGAHTQERKSPEGQHDLFSRLVSLRQMTLFLSVQIRLIGATVIFDNVVIAPIHHTVGSLARLRPRIVSAGSVGFHGRQPQPFRLDLQHFAVADAGDFPHEGWAANQTALRWRNHSQF